MSKPLDYTNLLPHYCSSIAIRCDRERAIYAAGVGLLWTALLIADYYYPHNSNSLDPAKAEVFFAEQVISGVALTWLAMGGRRILRCPLLRRDWFAWLCVTANLVAAFWGFVAGSN